MQQNFEQSGLLTVSSREPVHRTYAMRSGTLPSPGRRIVLNGRVGASRRSICMPVMTFLYVPKPYWGLRSAAKSLNPVATTTAPTSTSSFSSRAWRSMHPSTGQASMHSPHSLQTAQSRQRPAAPRASSSLSGASTSEKSTGFATRVVPFGRDARSEYAFWRASTSSLSTTGSRSSNPSRVPPVSQRSIMWAARRPSPTARGMSVAPFTTSPAAKTYGRAVWRDVASAWSVPFALVETWFAKAPVSAVMPIAPTTISHGITNSLPGTGSGRRRPEPVPGSEFVIPCEIVVGAIGMTADTGAFANHVSTNANGTLQADATSRQTALPYVFAAGDVVNGATDITRAVGEGRRAAHMIDRWLTGGALDGFDDRLPVVDKEQVIARQKAYALRVPLPNGTTLIAEPADFSEVEAPLTEAQARQAAGRCLDCAVCSECGECVAACPVDNCIDLHARDEQVEVQVGAVVVSTGYKLFAADLKPQYGFGTYKNVITGMQMDRLLAPTRPFNTILRPGDGKVPERIAYVLCTGSRDETVDNPLCSRFCCMYSIKQNQLIMGALPLADVTVHYIDIRAPGKRYDEIYEQAKSMGAVYVKGRVATITEKPDGNLILRYEDIENGGNLVDAEYDLVVLAVGVQPNRDAEQLFEVGELALDEWHYVAETEEDLNPGQTSIPGVFVAGAASGAKDIVDSILHAGAAVAQAAAHLELSKLDPTKAKVPA